MVLALVSLLSRAGSDEALRFTLLLLPLLLLRCEPDFRPGTGLEVVIAPLPSWSPDFPASRAYSDGLKSGKVVRAGAAPPFSFRGAEAWGGCDGSACATAVFATAASDFFVHAVITSIGGFL